MLRYDLFFMIAGLTELTDIKPFNILEIGSRDGHDTKELAKALSLPDSACYVIEAHPVCAENIRRTYPNFHVANYAVANTTGTGTFFMEPENVGASSLLPRLKPNPGIKTAEVPIIRMEQWIDALDLKEICVAKIDVEGLTLDVLKSFGKHINRLQAVQLELEHEPVWLGQSLYPETKEWLEANGFVQIMFVLMKQVQSDSLWVRRERLLK